MLILMRSSNGCNMRCNYCYGNYGETSGTLELDDCQLLLRRLKEEEVSGNKVEFLWHGGEPALLGARNFEKMASLLNTLEKDGIEVTHSLQSNGMGLNEPWPDILGDMDINVGISLDGPACLHDIARKTPEGSGTYVAILKNVNKLREANVKVSLLCTLGPAHENQEMEIADWLLELDLPIKFNPLFAKGRSRARFPLASYYGFLKNIFLILLKNGYGKSVQPFEWMLRSILYNMPPGECSFSGNCGKNIFSFGKGGVIGLCTRTQEVLGNLVTTSLKNIRESPRWLERMNHSAKLRKHCGKCEVLRFCHGGCPSTRSEIPDKADCAAIRDFFMWLAEPAMGLYLEALLERKKSLSMAVTAMQELRERLASGYV